MGQKISNKLTRVWIQPESTYGAYPTDWTDASKVYLLHATGADIKKSLEKKEDAANMGNKYAADLLKTKESVSGNLNITLHPEQFNKMSYLALGSIKNTEKAMNGFLVVYYTGAAESCIIEVTSTKLTAKVGALGSEVADTNFGTAGEITLNDAGNDTLAELKTLIDGYADYIAYFHGDGTCLSSNIPVTTPKQAKAQSVKLESIDSASTVKRHRIQPISTGGKPSVSAVIDKVIAFEKVTGIKIDTYGITANAGDLLTLECAIVAQDKQSIPSLPSSIITTFEATNQVAAGNMKMYINGKEQIECTSAKIQNNPNLLKDTNELGSFTISEPDDQQASLTIDCDYFYTDDTKYLEAGYLSESEVELAFYIESDDLVETGKKYSVWIRIPRCAIQESQAPIGSSGVIKLPTKFMALIPNYSSTNGYNTIEIDVLSKKSDLTA